MRRCDIDRVNVNGYDIIFFVQWSRKGRLLEGGAAAPPPPCPV